MDKGDAITTALAQTVAPFAQRSQAAVNGGHKEAQAVFGSHSGVTDAADQQCAEVDPAGRFFDNTKGHHTYSRPIREVGATVAWRDIDFDGQRFVHRGGVYEWRPAVDEGLVRLRLAK